MDKDQVSALGSFDPHNPEHVEQMRGWELAMRSICQEMGFAAMPKTPEEARKRVMEWHGQIRKARDDWRLLAVQYDGHRMKALWHLKAVVKGPNAKTSAMQFLQEPPVPGEKVLADRLINLAKEPLADRELKAIGTITTEWREFATGLEQRHIRLAELLKSLTESGSIDPIAAQTANHYLREDEKFIADKKQKLQPAVKTERQKVHFPKFHLPLGRPGIDL